MPDEDFLVRFNSTKGRITIIRSFIHAAGADKLRLMSLEQTQHFWDTVVVPNFESYGLHAADLIGLRSTGGANHRFNADGSEKLPFHVQEAVAGGQRYRMTEAGYLMIQHLVSAPAEEALASPDLRQHLATLRTLVAESNELTPEQKKDIGGLLIACEGVLDMDNPQRDLLRAIVTRIWDMLRPLGESGVRAAVGELVKRLFDFWPF